MRVEPVSGERLRYYVHSTSDEQATHVVDLSCNDGNGECSCDDFLFRRNPNWKNSAHKIVEYGPKDSTRCKHLNAAVLYYANQKLKQENLDLHRPKVVTVRESKDHLPF